MLSSLITPIRVGLKRGILERSRGWSRAELDAHQAREAAVLRRFALERSPFYRRFHKGLENAPLEELPILTKAAMMEAFDELVTDRAVRLAEAEEHLKNRAGAELFRGRYVVLSTSGSTGRRGVFLFNKTEWISVLANIARPILWSGIAGRITKPPRTAMIASRTPWHYSARVTQSLTTRLLPSLHLDAAEPIVTIVRRLNEWQPEFLAGYPSVVRELAEEQKAGRLKIRPRGISTAAEVLTAETRRRLRQTWGVKVFDTYGATEYAPIAAECAFGRKHLVEDGAIIEVVDERGRAMPAGEAGEKILLTVFHSRTQPLIRYEISDVVRLETGGSACECGRAFRVMGSIEGRVEEVLQFGAVSVHPNVFHEVLEMVPAAGWQVVQDEAGLTVNLAGLRDAAVCDAIARELGMALSRQGAQASIQVRMVEALERGATGKAPLVMSKMRRERAAGAGATEVSV